MSNLLEQKEQQDIVRKVCKDNGYEIVYANIDKATEEVFQTIRGDWFGASDSSKLLDVNPFPNGSSSDLLLEKLTGKIDESIGKKASVRMGKDIEHLIINKLNETAYFNHSIIKPVDMFGDFNTHLSVNFDGVNIIDGKCYPVEIKAVTKYGRKYYNFNLSTAYQKDGEWQKSRDGQDFEDLKDLTDIKEIASRLGIPVYYFTQIQQQMKFLNADCGALAVMDVDNWDIHIFYIPRFDFVIEELNKRAKDSWLKIKTRREIKTIK